MLQHFLTGLQLSIHHQLLLHEKPEILQQAIATATNVEYALNFDTSAEDTQEINAIQRKPPVQDASSTHKLQESLDHILKCLEFLEAVQKQPTKAQQQFAGPRCGQYQPQQRI